MLESDRDYVEGLKLRHDELQREIAGAERAVEFICERGETCMGEIGKHLSDLEILNTQAEFAGYAIAILETNKLPERITPLRSQRKGGDITDLIVERARETQIAYFVDVKNGKALCPFHDDHHPSMSVKNNLYHCFVCEASGDVIRFIMKMECLSFIEAVRYLNEKA